MADEFIWREEFFSGCAVRGLKSLAGIYDDAWRGWWVPEAEGRADKARVRVKKAADAQGFRMLQRGTMTPRCLQCGYVPPDPNYFDDPNHLDLEAKICDVCRYGLRRSRGDWDDWVIEWIRPNPRKESQKLL